MNCEICHEPETKFGCFQSVAIGVGWICQNRENIERERLADALADLVKIQDRILRSHP